MSVRLMSAAFAANLPDTEIVAGTDTHTVKASTAKFVLLALADHANDDGKGAYPSLDTLVKKTSMSRRSVQRAIDALTKMGIIRCVGVSEYGTDNYSIFDKAIPGGDSGSQNHDSGSQKDVPESPESSFKPSIKSPQTKQLRGIESAILQGRPVTEDDLLPESRPMISVLERLSALNPNWPRYGEKKDWDRLAKQLVGAELNGQKVETFVAWVRAQKNPADSIKWYGYKPDKIWTDYPLAFPVSTPRSEPYHEDESEYVIAPRLQKK